MTTTKAILNYAALQGGVFLRKDLLQGIATQRTNIKERALDLQLNRLFSSGKLLRKGRGEYMLSDDYLPEFVYQPTEIERNIFLRLKELFPLLDICIWSPQILSSYMLHVPNIGYILIDVEKDGMETVFHALQDFHLGRHILLAPSQKECERYLVGTDAIVVRQLIGQSPLTIIDGCTVPRIEKILVDAISDHELNFARGSEIYNIYENTRERYNVNTSKLLRYASRRNRKTQVEKIINTIENDKPKK